MSKSKKEPFGDNIGTSSLRRTIINPPSRSEDYDGASQNSRSKSSDSSPDRKKVKYGKPVGRGSESGIIFDKDELKKISITVKNKSAKPPLVHITNPETITPIRRQDEGKLPIFSKVVREDSESEEERRSSRKHYIEGRRKGDSRKRYDSPEPRRSRRSRRDSSGSRRHRRNRSTSSRHSGSCESTSSGDERRRRKHYYRMKSKEREERRRRMYEKEMIRRDLERRNNRPPSPYDEPSHSNGGHAPSYSRDRIKKESSPKEDDSSDQVNTYILLQQPVISNISGGIPNPRGMLVRRPIPPFLMRPRSIPFAPAFPSPGMRGPRLPGYPLPRPGYPPPRPPYYPVPPGALPFRHPPRRWVSAFPRPPEMTELEKKKE